jgi:hypothetical protein
MEITLENLLYLNTKVDTAQHCVELIVILLSLAKKTLSDLWGLLKEGNSMRGSRYEFI